MTRPRNLVLIGPDWEVTSRFRVELVQRLVRDGWRVIVLAGGGGGKHKVRLEAAGADCRQIELDRGSLNPLRDFVALLQILRICRRERPAAVLAFTVKPCLFGILGAWAGGVPTRISMVTGLGFAFIEGRELKRRVVRTAVRLLYNLAGRVTTGWIFQNVDDRNVLQELGAVARDAPVLLVGGSGVDLERFPYTPPPDRPTFLMIARLLAEKGVREYAAAAALVKAAHPEARFVLLGDRDSNPSAISADELAEWQRLGAIEYIGPADDVRPALAGAMVFVLPSYREGTPRAALEALAMGRPLIVTDVAGCREVVRAAKTGVLVDARNVPALRDAMLWYLDHPERVEEMGRAARVDCEARFDVTQVTKSISDFVLKLTLAAEG